MLKNILGFNYLVENGNKITIGGVRGVKTFLTDSVVVNIANGCVEVSGNNFKIDNFSEGEITICGTICGITHYIKGKSNEKSV